MPTVDPESLAILQFTSGSTADPKGVMLPHRCVTANIDAIRRGAAFDDDHERVASWLPLYHDMGLIGLLGVPMTTGVDLVLAGPQDFLAAPGALARLDVDVRLHRHRRPELLVRARGPARCGAAATSTCAPGGSRSTAPSPSTPTPSRPSSAPARRSDSTPAPRSASTAWPRRRSRSRSPSPGAGMTVDTVDRRVLETDRYAAPSDADRAGARRLPLLGRVLDGLELRVVDPDTGAGRHDREVGEVELRGASITPGYFRNPEATAASFRDGWLRTGDLGYVVDGELVICGRRKDVIIVGGRNVFPEDIERAAAGVDGVRAGNVIAFGTTSRRGREAIVVVAETKADDDGTAPVRAAVAERITDAIGIPPSEIVLVAPGTLPKTSSGKLQRSLCKDRYLSDVLEPVRSGRRLRAELRRRAVGASRVGTVGSERRRDLDHRPGDGVVALVGLGVAAGHEQVVDPAPHRVELGRVQQTAQLVAERAVEHARGGPRRRRRGPRGRARTRSPRSRCAASGRCGT